jgi:DNA mismatch repair ATPase MutS
MAWLERWQQRNGPVLSAWFDAVAKLEAFSSLAALAHDHPDWCYPRFDEDGDDVFAAENLGHPLLPTDGCVRNDVRLGPAGRLLLVTGSNMSGKSTLLRSIGVNAMLAQAGSVVCATGLVMKPVVVGTSMRVSDSLADGVSFFMAELRRLKTIVDEARACAESDRCMLFLLDEILQGTNSRERHLAVERILEHLLDCKATGAVSTHDIDLAQSPEISTSCDCVHFREAFVQCDGKETMTFDYRLREGVCPTTNALKLLEHVGLA